MLTWIQTLPDPAAGSQILGLWAHLFPFPEAAMICMALAFRCQGLKLVRKRCGHVFGVCKMDSLYPFRI